MKLRSSLPVLNPRLRDIAEDNQRLATAQHAEAYTRFDVSLINYRTAETTRRCLEALIAKVLPDIAVTVVDNDSGDSSVEAIAANPRPVTVALIRSPRNIGFSGSHNQSMAAQPDARFYLILNSDALVHPGALEALLAAAKANPEAGLSPPVSNARAARHRPAPSAAPRPSPNSSAAPLLHA